jgi:hypothetical protein
MTYFSDIITEILLQKLTQSRSIPNIDTETDHNVTSSVTLMYAYRQMHDFY